jgi:hypothetical protein
MRVVKLAMIAVAIYLLSAYGRENDWFGQTVGAVRGDPEIPMPRLDVDSRLYAAIKRHWYEIPFLARMECVSRRPTNYAAMQACIHEQTANQF